MLIPEIMINGRLFRDVPFQQLGALGADEATIADGKAIITAIEKRQSSRQKIAATAGDEASLLGTASDAAALAIYGLASFVAKLATVQSLAEVRAAAEPFAALSAGFLAKINPDNPTDGEVILPFMLKGLEEVIAEIETRSTAVSNALDANNN